MSKVNVSVFSGDISRVKSDAIITAINSGGMWFGGIDGVIQRAVGNFFHNQASLAMPLHDGQTIVARDGGSTHHGAFANVVFVVDDLIQTLTGIVYAGLEAADKAGFTSVTLPTIRMGVMLGVVEKSEEEAVVAMTVAVKNFVKTNPTSVRSITFVVYNNSKVQSLIQNNLAE